MDRTYGTDDYFARCASTWYYISDDERWFGERDKKTGHVKLYQVSDPDDFEDWLMWRKTPSGVQTVNYESL